MGKNGRRVGKETARKDSALRERLTVKWERRRDEGISKRERRAANEKQRTSANVDVKGENPLGASLRERVKRVFRLALN